MTTIVSVSDARDSFAEMINRVSYGTDRVAIRRRGRVMAGIVSAEDLALLEALNARDVKEARAAIAKAKGRKAIPWAKAKKELGL